MEGRRNARQAGEIRGSEESSRDLPVSSRRGALATLGSGRGRRGHGADADHRRARIGQDLALAQAGA